MLLIQNGDVYSPKHLGVRDLLISEGKIISVLLPSAHTASLVEALRAVDSDLEVLDAKGCRLTPGIIDRHVHFNGAGGEGGPRFRTPPMQLSAFIRAGVTSAVGLLGTDGTCRSLRELLMKARALDDEGITTWMLTGSYGVPSATLTGDVKSDICLIDKVIGLKLSLSDHRSSHPSVEELRRAVSDARVGGILAGKSGIVCVHMGSEKTSLAPLLAAIEGTDVPIAQFAPTHITRCKPLLQDSAAFAKRGGGVDITAETQSVPIFGVSTRDAILTLLDQGAPPDRITLSSDGNGSMPVFDEHGKMTGMAVGSIKTVLETLLSLWDDPAFDRETVLSFATSNVADHLSLKGKGRVEKGADADILAIDQENTLFHVVAKGKVMMRAGTVLHKGTFE
ncbi:MAG: beta-aspartyl-peptidase [Synergistaceae bacterium]|jgi:beta-aspartyl-dipeptidase (metallo-type)|nr:beta-aspartyl-peptidase [Synergistaceae bacterium]